MKIQIYSEMGKLLRAYLKNFKKVKLIKTSFSALRLTSKYLQFNSLSKLTKYFSIRLNPICEFKTLTSFRYFFYSSVLHPEILSKKTIGSRMGKGKGSIKIEYLNVKAYSVFFCIQNFNNYAIINFYKKIKKRFSSNLYYRYLVLFIKNSWWNKFIFWQFFFTNFFFDELFSHAIITIYKKLFILPGLFILDKLVSPWMGLHIFKKIFKNIDFIFWHETQNIYLFWFNIICAWVLLICSFFLLFF